MSFGWLGTFRQGSWRAFRRFVLEERRDVAQRVAVIEAELTRIGRVTVFYGESQQDDEGGTSKVSEERVGFSITPGTSLAKLFQAYIALGGNPFDVSLFLTPDATVLLNPLDEDMAGTPAQPYQGVVYPKSASYASGGVYEGGFMVLKKYVPARTGSRKKLEDWSVAAQVDRARRWASKEIRYKRNDIEARIIKLCDLREQLMHELEDLTWATAGVVAAAPFLDPEQYDPDLSVGQIVALIDSFFYEVSDDGTADFNTENEEKLGEFPFLLSDLSPDEDNTAL